MKIYNVKNTEKPHSSNSGGSGYSLKMNFLTIFLIYIINLHH